MESDDMTQLPEMTVYSRRFWRFYAELIKLDPQFSIKYKNESGFMKFLGWLMFFNPTFLTGYITTLGRTVYFPNQTKLDNQHSYHYSATLAHEYRHAADYRKLSLLFPLWYLFPQVLVIFSLLSFLAIWFGLGWLSCLAFLLCLAPWPAPGRRWIELRGFTMTLFMVNEFLKEANLNEKERRAQLLAAAQYYNSIFTDKDYYFMWPFGVLYYFQKQVEKIISAEIFKDDVIYGTMLEAWKKSRSTI